MKVGRPGMSDDAAIVAGTGGGPGSDQHVPPVSVGVGEDPGVAERVDAQWSAVRAFAPSGIGFQNRVAGVDDSGTRPTRIELDGVWSGAKPDGGFGRHYTVIGDGVARDENLPWR